MRRPANSSVHCGRQINNYTWDACQYPPPHWEYRFRPVRSSVRMPPFVSSLLKRRKTRRITTGMGYTGNFIALCGLIPLPFAGYWARTRNLYVQQHDGHQHDGEPLFVVIHHSSGDDWGAVHRSELLSLVRHDPHCGWGKYTPVFRPYMIAYSLFYLSQFG